ncbi:MAG TPA: hypothetical protein VK934_09355 [Fimbriimonas sp.]|nr:hypothetical protein [Fimbriimonas sp.]
MRLTPYALPLTLLLSGFAPQQDVRLQRQLTEGATEKYKVDMKMNTLMDMPGGLGEQEMGMTSAAEYELKFGKMNWQIPGMTVDATVTVTKMDAEGMMAGAMAGQGLPKPITMKAYMDLQGRLLPLKTQGAGGAMDLMGMQSFSFTTISIPLPAKPVKVGESWQVPVPKGMMAKKDQFLTATLTGERDGAWIVSTKGKFDIEMVPRALPNNTDQPNPMAGQKIGLKGTIEVDSEGLVEKATGKTLELKSKMKTDQTATIPDMGLEIKSQATVNTTVSLVR